MAVQTQIQVRRGTAATWTSTNPTLAAGEWGLETDTGKYKVGTGSAVWTSLGYASILPSTVTTKGDLLAATGNAAVSRLAVGSDGYQLVADSSQSTGLGWAGNSAAGKNAVINGGFDIWQRGTSFVPNTTAYGPDRWQVYRNTTGCTASRQTPGSTLPQFQYCARMQRDSGTTATNSSSYAMSLETSESLRFAGQTVTFSFYARAGANFSGSGASSMRIYLAYGTGTDQNVISGFTGVTYLVNGTVTAITTSWARYTFTVSVPSTATQLGFELNALWSGTAGANDWFEVTGVQLELGSSATPFSRAGGNIQGELAACQRYYIRQVTGSTYGNLAGAGFAASTTVAYVPFIYPVTMRVAPSAIETGNIGLQDGVNIYSSGTWTIDTANSTTQRGYVTYTHGSAALTQFRPYTVCGNNNTAAYLGFSAEL